MARTKKSDDQDYSYTRKITAREIAALGDVEIQPEKFRLRPDPRKNVTFLQKDKDAQKARKLPGGRARSSAKKAAMGVAKRDKVSPSDENGPATEPPIVQVAGTQSEAERKAERKKEKKREKQRKKQREGEEAARIKAERKAERRAAKRERDATQTHASEEALSLEEATPKEAVPEEATLEEATESLDIGTGLNREHPRRAAEQEAERKAERRAKRRTAEKKIKKNTERRAARRRRTAEKKRANEQTFSLGKATFEEATLDENILEQATESLDIGIGLDHEHLHRPTLAAVHSKPPHSTDPDHNMLRNWMPPSELKTWIAKRCLLSPGDFYCTVAGCENCAPQRETKGAHVRVQAQWQMLKTGSDNQRRLELSRS